MKKVFILFLSLFLLTGCSFTNNNNVSTVYTTYYPFEYATKYMYGEFADISSIYPSEVDIDTYELTNKQREKYSSGNIFVYTGLTKEVKLAVDFVNENRRLNLIDATNALSFTSGIEELWLNPSNYLMIARNIKSTLNDYEPNLYNREKVNELYEELKIKISELDVEYTMMGNNASRKDILIADDALAFLSKYNINVLSLDPESENYSRSYNEAKRLASSGDIKYIYVLKGKALSNEIETFITENNLEKQEIDTMYTLSEEQRKVSGDYISIMKENIDMFKTELFR